MSVDIWVEPPLCTDCQKTAQHSRPDYCRLCSLLSWATPDPLNLNGSNAALIAAALRIDLGDSGSEKAELFCDRVQSALRAEPVDAGQPAAVDGNWTYCGRRPGYLQDKLGQLLEIVRWASLRGLDVCWG